TYTEPTVYFEYAYDIARQAAENEILTVLVTNGFINPAPLKKIAPFVTGANVDLKGWSDDFYRQICGGELKPVLQTLRQMKKSGIWVEVTTLMVTGLVDNEKQLREIAQFILDELGPETPWHISRFYPHYRFYSPPTPPEKLSRARAIGLDQGLQYVYCGNLAGDEGENTYCPSCGKLLIHRYGFTIVSNIISEDRCPDCHTEIAGLGMNHLN
ncbi:MAG: radical SAM protein, partial [Calditrichaeota bacterium]